MDKSVPVPRVPAEMTPMPFINHMVTVPVDAWRHRMSALPSPLKSPTPAIDQSVPVPMVLAETTLVPFINHIMTVPVDAWRHRMSALPSPLKSPTPAMDQSVPAPMVLAEITLVPFINHIVTAPLDAWRHRMSDLPSALKSARGGPLAGVETICDNAELAEPTLPTSPPYAATILCVPSERAAVLQVAVLALP